MIASVKSHQFEIAVPLHLAAEFKNATLQVIGTYAPVKSALHSHKQFAFTPVSYCVLSKEGVVGTVCPARAGLSNHCGVEGL